MDWSSFMFGAVSGALVATVLIVTVALMSVAKR